MEISVPDDVAFALVVVATGAVVAPLLSDHLARWVLVPSVVLEIVLGILIGPEVFGLVGEHPALEDLSHVGLAVLFFLAGYEIEFREVAGRPLVLAASGWAVSFAVALAAAAAAGAGPATLIIAIALATTALGTILPIAGDAGLLRGGLGPRLMAVGAVGEFLPIVLLALLFSEGTHSGATTAAILVIALVVGAAVLGSLRRSERVSRMLSATLGTSIQFAIRLSVLALLAAVLLAAEIGVDIALGAFAAGIVMHVIFAAITDEEAEVVKSKLEAIGYGWVIPVFFIYTGVTFQLGELLSSVSALALVPVFLAGFALVRGVTTWLVFSRDLDRPQRTVLGWFAATELPIVVVAAGVAESRGLVSASVAAAMVGAAMLSVLVFPMLGLRVFDRASQSADA